MTVRRWRSLVADVIINQKLADQRSSGKIYISFREVSCTARAFAAADFSWRHNVIIALLRYGCYFLRRRAYADGGSVTAQPLLILDTAGAVHVWPESAEQLAKALHSKLFFYTVDLEKSTVQGYAVTQVRMGRGRDGESCS